MTVYIHIPFCACRCAYCDFYSTTRMALRDDYIDALLAEMALRRGEMGTTNARTLYIGGGTPSQLTATQLVRLFDGVGRYFRLASDAEVTIEANPDDVTLEFVAMLRQTPVNRISMGVQTFHDPTLRLLRRRHDAEQARRAVALLREAGYSNISIDLIYGLPGQTLGMFEADIEAALALGVYHLSAYSLMYEEGTPLYRMMERGEVEEADEELSLAMFRLLIARLKEAGFEHYEISNFALPGHRSRHNSSYWTGEAYLGLGAGAHSYNGREVRSWNAGDLESYIRCATAGDFGHCSEREMLTDEQRFEEAVFLSLRTCEGIDLGALRSSYGAEVVDGMLRRAAPWIEQGKVELTPTHLRLMPEGIFISDAIMAELI